MNLRPYQHHAKLNCSLPNQVVLSRRDHFCDSLTKPVVSHVVKCPENETVSMTRMNCRNHFVNSSRFEIDRTIVTL